MGRKTNPPKNTWALEFNNPENNITFATISMCIKEAEGQTLFEIAERVAYYKNIDEDEAFNVLLDLQEKHMLGTYDENFDFWEYIPPQGE